jgi:hypothetical protein
MRKLNPDLLPLRLNVGSAPDADIIIDDPAIAEHHAEVELAPGIVHLRSLDASNGVFVNNRLIRDCNVQRSDRIRLGKSDADFWRLLDAWWQQLVTLASSRTALAERERELASKEQEFAELVGKAREQSATDRAARLQRELDRVVARLPEAAWQPQPIQLSGSSRQPADRIAVAFDLSSGLEAPVLVPVAGAAVWKFVAPASQAATAWRLASQSVARLCVADPPGSWNLRALDPFSRLAALREVAGLPATHTTKTLEVAADSWLTWASEAQERLVAFRRERGRGVWNTRPEMWEAAGGQRPLGLGLTLVLHDGQGFFAGREKVLAQWLRDAEDLGERLVFAGPPLDISAALEIELDTEGQVRAAPTADGSPTAGTWLPIDGATVLGWSDPEVQGKGREGVARLWDRSADRGIRVSIGQATDGKRLSFALAGETAAFHGLVGGTTGSGKTVLLHGLISGLAMRYAPWELEFVLADFKEGTEFKRYSALPHLRALCLTTDPETGLGVLRHLLELVVERGRAFKDAGVANIESYRSFAPMPRILVVLDEFQVLLSGHGAAQTEAANALEDLVRRGRSFGIHLVLATQTLMDVELSSSTRSNLAVRIAFRLQAADAARLLVYENDAPVQFRKPGEGLYNAQHGEVVGNQGFQADYVSPAALEERLRAIAEKGATAAMQAPEGWQAPPRYVLDEMQRPSLSEAPSGLVLGKPRRLTHDWFSLEVETQPGENIAVVGGEQRLRRDAVEVLANRLVALGHAVTWLELGRTSQPISGARLVHEVGQLDAALSELEGKGWTRERQAWLVIPQATSLRARREQLTARPEQQTGETSLPDSVEEQEVETAIVDSADFEAFLAEHMGAALQAQMDARPDAPGESEAATASLSLLERLGRLVQFGGSRDVHVIASSGRLQDLGEELLDAYLRDSEFRHMVFVTTDEAERHLGLQSPLTSGTVVVADAFAGGSTERVVLCDPKS